MQFDAGALWQSIQEQLAVTQVMLARPVVLVQIVAIVVILAFSWIVPNLVDGLLRRFAPPDRTADVTAPPQRARWRERIVRLLQAFDYTLFPILALILLGFVIGRFSDEGQPYGLIESILPLFWLLLAYRLLVGVGLAAMPPASAARFANHFVRPLLLIFLLYFASRLLFQTLAVADVTLFDAQGVSLQLGSLLEAMITFLVFYVASWVVYEAVSRLLKRSEAEPGVRQTVSNVSRYALLGLGVLSALSVLGIDMSTLAWIGGGLAVGIGFGLQELVSNFVSGLLLTVERSVRPGDVIEIGGLRGVVNEVGMRSTLIKTADNTEIFIPNKELLIKPMTAFTYSDRSYRVKLVIGVAYTSDIVAVQTLLLETIKRHPLIISNPEPLVWLTELGSYSLNFTLTGYVQDYDNSGRVRADLNRMVSTALAEQGFEIPFPRQEIVIIQPDNAQAPAINQQ